MEHDDFSGDISSDDADAFKHHEHNESKIEQINLEFNHVIKMRKTKVLP